MRHAFTAAVDALARVVASTAGSTADWPRVARSAVRDLTSEQRLEIASANELTFQRALDQGDTENWSTGMTALDMKAFTELNKQWEADLKSAGERAKFRDAAIASLKRQLAEEKKVEEARKRPLSKEDRSNLAQTAQDIHRNERELKRIEKVMRSNLDQYYAEGLDEKYQELTRP